MKTPEDEAFDELARKQGAWGGGYQAKREAAADKQKLWDKPSVAFDEWWNGDNDESTNPFRLESGAYWAWAGWKAALAQPAHCQCTFCKDGILHASDCAVHNGPAYPAGECDCGVLQEALYGMNQDDWKDVVAAIAKVRDGRGIYLGCRPADVFQDWFLALGTAKVKKEKSDDHGQI